jgi:L-lactate dehydrogenase
LAPYLTQIESGGMALDGEPVVVSDWKAAFHWNAGRLPGAWVLNRAVESLVARAKEYPVTTASIGECFHIGALQVYLEAITRRDLIGIIAATDPSVRSVAPFGGIDPVLTSNPVACGIPTRGGPILIDLCTSTLSNAGAMSYAAQDRRLPGQWLLDNKGNASDDPGVLAASPRGTLLPLGGMDLGYKGFGLGIIVEALALALSGYGRTGLNRVLGEGVFVQVINPAHFAGREYFLDEMQYLADCCRRSRPIPGGPPVRLPGDRALAHRDEADAEGLVLPDFVTDALAPWMERHGISLPPEKVDRA